MVAKLTDYSGLTRKRWACWDWSWLWKVGPFLALAVPLLILTSASLVRLETRVEADTRELRVEVRELNAEFGQLRTDLTTRIDTHRAAQREETASLKEEIRSIRTDVIELLTDLRSSRSASDRHLRVLTNRTDALRDRMIRRGLAERRERVKQTVDAVIRDV